MMLRSSPLLRSSGRTIGARLAGPRPPSTARQPLCRLDVRTTSIRLSSSSNQPPKLPSIDPEHHKNAPKKLEPNPEGVSSTSSVRTVLESSGGITKEPPGIQSGLKHDIDIVKDTFRLDTVPRESHILGLAGTLPYLATSISTVFLALNLNTDIPSGNRLYNIIFLEHDTAKYLLDFIEPLQLGYGAVIISFLGAIHWGLEYAEKKPQHDRTRFRYGIGLGASIVAWPTLMMPIEYALTTQFGAFVALYYADSRATRNGWAPTWYAKYRFLLTAMVGLAIVISLVGRAEISQRAETNKKSLRAKVEEPGIADKQTDWAKLEKEEKDRIRKEKAKKAREEGQAKKKKQQEEIKGNGKKKDEDEDDKDKEKENKDDDSDDSQDSEAKDDDDTSEADDESKDESSKNDKPKDNDKSDDDKSEDDESGGDESEGDEPKDNKSKDNDKSKDSKDDKSKDNKSKEKSNKEKK